jgi:hypothetical protein
MLCASVLTSFALFFPGLSRFLGNPGISRRLRDVLAKLHDEFNGR